MLSFGMQKNNTRTNEKIKLCNCCLNSIFVILKVKRKNSNGLLLFFGCSWKYGILFRMKMQFFECHTNKYKFCLFFFFVYLRLLHNPKKTSKKKTIVTHANINIKNQIQPKIVLSYIFDYYYYSIDLEYTYMNSVLFSVHHIEIDVYDISQSQTQYRKSNCCWWFSWYILHSSLFSVIRSWSKAPWNKQTIFASL